MFTYARARRPGLENDQAAPAHHTTTTTSFLLRCVPAVNKTNASAERDPCLPQDLLRPASLLLPLVHAVGHGGDGRSAGEAAGRALHAPPRAVGAPAAAASTPPRARCRVALGGSVGRPRSPPLVVRVPPQGRRRDRGAPGEAHGPPARRGRPASRAQEKSSPAPAAPAAEGQGPRGRAHGAASTSTGAAAAAAAGGRCGKAVEAAGAHAAAAGRAVVVMAGGAASAVEAAQARPVLRSPVYGRDRGGHLRADGRPAAAAAEEAAARRTAAARYALPRALAGRGHRRRLQGARRRVAAPPPPSRRRRRARRQVPTKLVASPPRVAGQVARIHSNS